jgi:hypothetical protein
MPISEFLDIKQLNTVQTKLLVPETEFVKILGTYTK